MGRVPVLSVVMPVHNAMPYIDVSIASILDQSFSDFELVIRDDGSDDGSDECLRAWAQSTASTRLTSDQTRVERSIDRMYRCLSLHVRGRAYDHLLEPDAESQCDGKLHPRTFISLGSSQLWSGGRPRLWKRACRGARLGLDLASLQCLVWAAWATLHPGSLRLMLKLLLRIRNHWIFHRISKNRLYDWQPVLAGRAVAFNGHARHRGKRSQPGIDGTPHARAL